MNERNSQPKSFQIGPGFLGILAIVFITLKLCGVIQWSWLWVLAPLWLPLAVFLGLAVVAASIAGCVGVVLYFLDNGKAKKRR